MVICPKCGSPKVFEIRVKWGYSYEIGDYTPANDRAQHTDEEWNTDPNYKPDIDVFHCLRCSAI